MNKTLFVACVGTLSTLLGGCIDVTPTSAKTTPTSLDVVRHSARREATLNENFGLTELPTGKATPHDFAVRVYRSGTSRGAGSCSGALISPTKVVTALHCVVEVDESSELTNIVRDADDLHVEFGGGYLPWGRVPVIDVRTCGDYQRGAAHDVAVIELAEPAPSDVPILRIATEAPLEGDEFASYGFGSETPRALPLTGFKVESVKRHARMHVALGVMPAAITFSGGSIHGDSGAPIINRETGEIVAVVSEGSEHVGVIDSASPRAPADTSSTSLTSFVSVAPAAAPSAVTVGARLDACASLFSR